MRPVFRPDPVLPVQRMQTYQIVAPTSTHYRAASCAEVDCANRANGFKILCDESAPEGAARAQYLRSGPHGRKGMTWHQERSGVTAFVFPPGTECIAACPPEQAAAHKRHLAPLEREPIYVVRDGDFRGNPTGRRTTFRNGDDWVDDFGEHQDRIKTQIEKG